MTEKENWLARRDLTKLSWIGTRTVPAGVGWWYTFGSATLTAFIVQVLTGAFLMMNYSPSPDHAYESVQYLSNGVLFGSLVRSLHHWSAYAMIVLVGMHALRVFFMAAYRFPRELTWIAGVMQLLLVAGMAFTGYLLPWDERAYWATMVGTRIAGEVPLIGAWLETLLVGGTDIGALTLSRFFALHVVILPGILAAFISLHLFLVVYWGVSAPPGATRAAGGPTAGESGNSRKSIRESYEEIYEASKRGGRPFFPDVISHDALVSLVVVAVVFVLAIAFPAASAPPADPTRTAFSPRPEWYFVFFQQWLRLFPGKLEPVGAVIFPALAILVILLVPFFNRGLDRTYSKRKGIIAAGASVVAVGLVLEVTGVLYPPTLAVPAAPALVRGETYAQVAQDGQTAYQNSCASCHGSKGEGVVAPALIGPKARTAEYRTAEGLLTFLSTSMPPGSPGSLPRQNYIDITAYLLVRNDVVSGDAAFDASRFAGIALK